MGNSPIYTMHQITITFTSLRYHHFTLIRRRLSTTKRKHPKVHSTYTKQVVPQTTLKQHNGNKPTQINTLAPTFIETINQVAKLTCKFKKVNRIPTLSYCIIEPKTKRNN